MLCTRIPITVKKNFFSFVAGFYSQQPLQLRWTKSRAYKEKELSWKPLHYCLKCFWFLKLRFARLPRNWTINLFSLNNDSSLGLMKTIPQRSTTSFHFGFASPQKTRCSTIPTAASVPFTLEVFSDMRCFLLFILCTAFVISYCEGFTACHTTSEARPGSNIEDNYLHQNSGQRNR